ncbi:peptidoglycan glycosyltransferase FtsW [Bifidobacterium sp.]|jgi:cell division protein FtsW|uniref:peptidoglycan glycosyltransferase FtsW n=1 Tax=Bifidobacterium sp. TaxID=41200 RepID=UPI0025C69967|nr:putative peptidoglycan glycosyltransferase FtsW [Bifidobacterium sp.]MCH4209263.1 putative lipid II flippase FtsW [Bifidobacterium sp.]MCI1224057.1 putative lipid II flippase FtsW [Bifidobacterium sp.]
MARNKRSVPHTARTTDAKAAGLAADARYASSNPEEHRAQRFGGVRALSNPLWCYNGFRIAVVLLTCFGVIMVFSSSAITMISRGASPWKQALSQGVYCVLGFALGIMAMVVPVKAYRRFGFVLVCLAIGLQLLTMTPLGVSVNGNSGWIGIKGVFTMQPAEVVKLALCIWLPAGMELAKRRYGKDGIKAYGLPIGMFALCLMAVMAGKDLGTALILVFIGVTALLIGGFPMRWLLSMGVLLAAFIAAFVITSPNRMQRILSAYQPCSADQAIDECYQAIHAKYAMGSGGLLGVGIGNSREKWNYLPEAHNDFIFAIIGEETGFIGAVMVILMFVALGWCLVSVAMQSESRYVSMVLVCIAIWLVGQGLVNIMVVIGLLPVMGVPMPFVSAGGSSLIMCLVAAGVAVSMMRAHPQISAGTSALNS